MLMKLFMFNQISLYCITRQAYVKVSEENRTPALDTLDLGRLHFSFCSCCLNEAIDEAYTIQLHQ